MGKSRQGEKGPAITGEQLAELERALAVAGWVIGAWEMASKGTWRVLSVVPEGGNAQGELALTGGRFTPTIRPGDGRKNAPTGLQERSFGGSRRNFRKSP